MSGNDKQKEKKDSQTEKEKTTTTTTPTPTTSSWIVLNVGGTLFTTCHDTLSKTPNSTLLGAMFSGRNHHLLKCQENGWYNFDRSPLLFPYVLEYHRNQRVQFPPKVSRKALIDEYNFWGIPLPQNNPILCSLLGVAVSPDKEKCDCFIDIIMESLYYHSKIDYYELNGTIIEMLPKPWANWVDHHEAGMPRDDPATQPRCFLKTIRKVFRKFPPFQLEYIENRRRTSEENNIDFVYSDDSVMQDICKFHQETTLFPDPSLICKHRENRKYLRDQLEQKGFEAVWHFYQFRYCDPEHGVFYNPPYLTKTREIV